MDNRYGRSIQEIKQIDMVEYLASLGFYPARVRGANHWYNSPLHADKDPSFKIDSRLNMWFDFSEGKGGNIIDFGILFHKCSVGDFLKIINSGTRHAQHLPQANKDIAVPEGEKVIIKAVKPLTSPALLAYVVERRIDLGIAKEFCRQVDFILYGRSYFAIGFENRSGGFELRNRIAKLASSPKDCTIISNGSSTVAVSEGFMDMLSFMSLLPADQRKLIDYHIMNSTTQFAKTLAAIDGYSEKLLLLDNDPTGQAITKQISDNTPNCHNLSNWYSPQKDLNDWHSKGAVQQMPLAAWEKPPPPKKRSMRPKL